MQLGHAAAAAETEHDNNTPSLALSWWKGRTGTWRVWYGYRDWVWM